MSTRGKSVDLPDWWLAMARTAADNFGGNLTELGIALAKVSGRPDPWHQSVIVRFLQGRNPTVELAEAFSILLGVPRLIYAARSAAEALALHATASRFSTATQSGSAARIAQVDQVLESMELEVQGQSPPVESTNERGSIGGRARSTGRSS